MSNLNPARKSAAEIAKGARPIMIISEAEVIRLLDLQDLLNGLADGFRSLSRGEIQTPNRPQITVPEAGFLLPMAAWRKGDPMMVKMVSVFDGNLDVNLPNHLALINLFDEATGMPICVMDGTYITGIRTAAAAVLSVRELARPNARVATIIGAGVQGREHLRLLPLVRDFDEIQICSLYKDDAEKLAAMHPLAVAVEDVGKAVRKSDVVCLCSHSNTPVLGASAVQPGTHVTSVGYTPRPGELPQELVREHHLFVEHAIAFEPQPVGCAELQGVSLARATMLGDMLCGSAPGRVADDQITVYKAMGIAMEDLVASSLVYNAARAEHFSTSVIF